MQGIEFCFDYIHLLYHKRHEINWNCHGSNEDSSNWIKK